ncbi:hypothetical protein [Tumebacillus permanentifrigoris]|uniref:Tail assembly chaperone E/41/14-like protein n=1 Tax=Tumebacillus permanentifrigoris TaxID=378543 RepID=A0A316DU24_9BACL|nr:hypothetical protein [Tumebacillus permanentifrigoris]PWK11523.1 hypothetical protein C7459_11052 [Tumebacillus permanentifrigoris]
MAFQTEYEFVLPRGYVDEEGTLHRRGVMRLATAADEILPMRDPRVQSNPSYLSIILLARVITKLGDLHMIDTRTVEGLFTADLAYLQSLYRQVNEGDGTMLKACCPKCDHDFEVDMSFQTMTSGA